MPHSAGTQLGPYEISSLLGAGGMGEVYRARDPRLQRDVAIKVLPSAFAADGDRLRRFEQEARAAGILNHPNILAIYDIGTTEGAPYVVSELLEGATLRERLAAGPLSTRKAIEYALQVVQGLAAAHEKGIVHRDLKPENLFVTEDGRVKILDFGLAKLTQPEAAPGAQTAAPTAAAGTEPGVVMGTAGYMSPEQVRGMPADHRSDIFSFGAILYEMLAGRRAFRGDSAIETMSAILREDPPEISETNRSLPPALERLVRHCLEKSPAQRFQSARDLAYDLESLSGVSGASAVQAVSTLRTRRKLGRLAAAAGLVAALLLAFWIGNRLGLGAGKRAGERGAAVFSRLTYRRGNVLHARFAPDGQTIVYSAAWGDKPAEIFLTRTEGRDSRSLGIPNATIASISSSGELAILLKKRNVFGTLGSGTLARVPLTGGAPREILEEVYWADWSPDGASLAVVRVVHGKTRIEYPIGKLVYETSEDLWAPRVSPDGAGVVFGEWIDGAGAVSFVDRSGKKRTLTSGWITVDTLAWHPSGEIWFDGLKSKNEAGIFSVTLGGRLRAILQAPDILVLHDVNHDGKGLVEREAGGNAMVFAGPGDKQERDLSWLESSSIAQVSEDGQTLLFTEGGEGGGDKGSVYLRASDGSPAIRLGDGQANSLSPDGKWALALVGSPAKFVLLPTGAGEARPLPVGKLNPFGGAFLPDGKRIVFEAVEPGHASRGYVMDVSGGQPRAFSPEGITGGAALSPDGKLMALGGGGDPVMIYPLEGGDPKPVAGLEPKEVPIQWSADGRSLFVTRYGELPIKVFRLDLASSRRELWKELAPAERAGFIRFNRVFITRDGRSYAYSYARMLASDLYLVSGLK